MLTVGSLFAGIGGFDLGLERAGMRVIWQSEIDPYASAVLKKHWPEVPNHGDIRSIRVGAVERPDVLAGGFPCQDISVAGKGAGIDGERSGLWSEYARVIGELRPRYVIVENVAALLGRGLGRVLGDLAALGFDAEWHCIPASAVGAPHRRDRLWIIANARGEQHEGASDAQRRAPATGLPQDVAHARRDGGESVGGTGQLDGTPSSREIGEEERQWVRDAAGSRGAHVADADYPRLEGRISEILRECASERAAGTGRSSMADSSSQLCDGGDNYGCGCGECGSLPQSGNGCRSSGPVSGWWLTEPDVGRVANGVPSRVDRLRCLGNAIVPQIAEIIGRAIVSAHHAA